MYLFPCVQNTTHVSQEADQNYGHFKSLLRKYVQVLMNELLAQAQRDNNPGAAVSLSHKCYGILLSGRVAHPERGL
jgi:hypothetical protein